MANKRRIKNRTNANPPLGASAHALDTCGAVAKLEKRGIVGDNFEGGGVLVSPWFGGAGRL
jgi:hypothetical protein